MAIRPVDLQLAYMAAPQNAALVSHAQESAQTAQQAAQKAFAAEVAARQEQVDGPQKTAGQKIHPREEREPAEHEWSDQPRDEDAEEEAPVPGGPFGLAGEGEHFIDVTA